jgi:glycogen debranching enzyme
MEVLQREPAEDVDFLISNGSGMFLLMPAKQCRNERHREREIQNPSKWHGVFLKAFKVLEGWNTYIGSALLSPENQVSFETDLTTITRRFIVDDSEVVEEVFIPNNSFSISIKYTTQKPVVIQPEFDIRHRYSEKGGPYESSILDDTVLVSAPLYAVAGGGRVWKDEQYRYKFYPEDWKRKDTNERWVYAPAKFETKQLFIGFGESREEAISNFANIKNYYLELKLEKESSVSAMFERHRLESGNSELKKAYRLALYQLLTLQHDSVLPASGDRWFAGDEGWGRDTAISLEAFFELGLFDTAKRILNYWVDEGKQRGDGRLPNKIEPLQYNSSDCTLWFLRRLAEYVQLTGDYEFFKMKQRVARKFFEGVEREYLTMDGFIRSNAFESWMDTKFTPREGFPVEVQALFIKNCMLYSKLFQGELADKLAHLYEHALKSFQKFKVKHTIAGVEKAFMLADLINFNGERVNKLTPNQLIAVDCGIVEPELERSILEIVREHLAGVGIRSLSPGEVDYFDEFTGDQSYHRGAQWPWLNYLAVKAEVRNGNKEVAYKTYIEPLVKVILNRNWGGVSEVYSGNNKACICPHYQTWSLASFIICAKQITK